MFSPLQAFLKKHHIMVLDGAMATELERRGADLSDSLWSARLLLDDPQMIKAVHASYFAAGADCATTATYQATFEGFARRGLTAEQSAELMLLAVRLATEARDEYCASPAFRPWRGKPLVAASIGSYGAYLADGSEYRGNYGVSEQALIDFHRPRMALLAQSGADLLACETIPCLSEAMVLARLLNEFPHITAWISFSAHTNDCISSGENATDCGAALERFDQVSAIGFNCTPPRHIPALIQEIRRTSSKPIIVYPNSGENFNLQTRQWECGADPRPFSELAQAWVNDGARLIGGCCRTTPQDIQQIANWARDIK